MTDELKDELARYVDGKAMVVVVVVPPLAEKLPPWIRARSFIIYKGTACGPRLAVRE